MSQPRIQDPAPVVLDVVPASLRERSDEERRALAFAAGEDPDARSDARLLAAFALVLLLSFALAALLR